MPKASVTDVVVYTCIHLGGSGLTLSLEQAEELYVNLGKALGKEKIQSFPQTPYTGPVQPFTIPCTNPIPWVTPRPMWEQTPFIPQSPWAVGYRKHDGLTIKTKFATLPEFLTPGSGQTISDKVNVIKAFSAHSRRVITEVSDLCGNTPEQIAKSLVLAPPPKDKTLQTLFGHQINPVDSDYIIADLYREPLRYVSLYRQGSKHHDPDVAKAFATFGEVVVGDFHVTYQDLADKGWLEESAEATYSYVLECATTGTTG